MDLQTRKIAFVQDFLKLESEKVIVQFEKLLQKQTDSNATLEPMNVADFQKRIKQSLSDSNEGKLTSSEHFLEEIAEWK
ncbi:hypothetical protein [Flavobacterium ammonificans]|uniref:hypothetical protein n=1 Tax=Flavobacterium ammonificans TaxID=1751056 RepID=UPI001E49DD1E|nr:hypothetical protein [Flavobacterium ammonificans]BDB56781.1 hypothetical protein SHINM13_10770 [Flavobacterium ammonificans]